MNRVFKYIIVLQIALTLFIAAVPAFADTPAPPRDYTVETENGKYVFVMLAPPEKWSSKSPGIRDLYKQSGLYRNDGSQDPLWVVYWYSFTVYPSSDGKHLVRMGPWASSTDQLAVAFYENGKEIKQYLIKDLIRDEKKLSYTVSHFFWRSELRYDDKNGLLFLKTKDGQSYRFSVNTGQIEPEKKNGQNP